MEFGQIFLHPVTMISRTTLHAVAV